jgi:anti-anti-sigma factor
MQESNITINIRSVPAKPNLKIIAIKGTFDAVTSMHVDKKVLPVIEQDNSNVIIDLSNVDYLSSVGIVCLAQYLVLLTEKKRILKFVKPPARVYETLTLIGFAKKLDMYDSIETAIGSFK